jgi:hypothetical protein
VYLNRTAVITCVVGRTQTLPEPAVAVGTSGFLNVGAASGSPTLQSALTPTSSAALGTNAVSSSQIQFDGVPGAHSNVVVLAATAAAGQQLLVPYAARGAANAAS